VPVTFELGTRPHPPRDVPEHELGLTKLPARIQDEGGVSYQHFSAAAELRQLVAGDLAGLRCTSRSFPARSRIVTSRQRAP
jgi:hypothetical protein